jgi:uncharacterized repeat protein (TIGR04138 family)
MQEASFDQAIDQILASDSRYARDAYQFVREALEHTQKLLTKPAGENAAGREGKAPTPPPVHHVTGQELLGGIRSYALQQFGPMVPTVFEEWGIRRCADFGEIVFNMVEIGVLAKTDKDSREDFKDGYDFDAAFRQPFLPGGHGQSATRSKNETE